MIPVQLSEFVLLTGAGFTKNFGGLLGNEMWPRIVGNKLVQQSPYLRPKLQADSNYESVYSGVMKDTGASPEDKKRLHDAIYHAYHVLDEATRVPQGNLNIHGVMDLLCWFGNKNGPKGVAFTTNQDVKLERMFQFLTPGVPEIDIIDKPQEELTPLKFVRIRDGDTEAICVDDLKNRNGIIYIKLHGSFGWTRGNGPAGLVIGTDKTTLINDDALLRWNFQFFKEVIAQGRKKLLVIGYGFKDEHINKVLLDGVEKHGLQIYIISPSSKGQLEAEVTSGNFYALPIFKGLSGYYQHTLAEIFPASQVETIFFKELRDEYLKG
ncbi:MAG: SIR2 family protein [Planctomycetes bacterium]|nr:SIR2 family protein [Planctomycetota bacterium]